MIDIVYGDKEPFLKTAEEMGIDGLLSIGKEVEIADRPGSKKQIVLLRKFQLTKKQNTHYLYTSQRSKSMHYPIKITQVLMKDLHRLDKSIFFSYTMLKDPRMVEEIAFLTKLCRKYKVPLVIASFARKPKDLRAPGDLQALCRVIGMDTKQAKQAVNHLKELMS